MPLLISFWIAIYCTHPNRCDVYKDTDGIAVQKYQTLAACEADKTAHVHKNTQCLNVNSVSCYNGGSACTFDPADDAAWKLVHKMVPLPQ